MLFGLNGRSDYESGHQCCAYDGAADGEPLQDSLALCRLMRHTFAFLSRDPLMPLVKEASR